MNRVMCYDLQAKKGGDMKSIRIENVRSLRDTGDVDIAPITLLVGKNSTGKSTFLKAFPLIKQSLVRNTVGPLLWVGDDNGYVDFGGFDDAVSFGEDSICFSFVFEVATGLLEAGRNNPLFINSSVFEAKEILKYTITIKHKDTDYVSEALLEIRIGKSFAELLRLSYDVGEDGEVILAEIDIGCENHFDAADMKNIPQPYRLKSSVHRASSIFGFHFPDPWTLIGLFDAKTNCFSNMNNPEALARIGACLSNGIAFENLRDFPDDEQAYFRYCQEILESKSEKDQRYIYQVCKGLYDLDLLRDADQKLNDILCNIHYIAPVRATAERYIRIRNLAVDEVDCQGRNLAVYLNDMSENDLKKCQEWTANYFGFRIYVQGETGHFSLSISIEGSYRRINLADVGFGYSQILPILAELWSIAFMKSNSAIFLIEQPELHLHPALQGKLVRAIADIAAAARGRLSIIMETHGKTFIEELGMAIDEKKLDRKLVNVVLFEMNGMYDSKVTATCFDEFGYLEKWPLGFLDAEL